MAEDNNILDFYPDGEEDSCAEDSYVTLVDDEGNEVEMSVVDIVEHKGENYVILLPVENIESGDMQFAVMKIEYDEETDEYTYVTGTEPEYDEVFIEFRERLEQELSIIDDDGGELDSETTSIISTRTTDKITSKSRPTVINTAGRLNFLYQSELFERVIEPV